MVKCGCDCLASCIALPVLKQSNTPTEFQRRFLHSWVWPLAHGCMSRSLNSSLTSHGCFRRGLSWSRKKCAVMGVWKVQACCPLSVVQQRQCDVSN